MPAEWEHHDATWLGWPHNATDWPGKFTTIPWVYGEIVRKLVPGEIVRIIIDSRAREQSTRRILTKAGIDLSSIEFFRLPTDRGWTRDTGPMFVRRTSPQRDLAINNFNFTGWAKYDNWKSDAKIHERVSRVLGIRLFHPAVNGKRFVLEGGAIDVNGRGTLLTTEECLLDQKTQVRNPGLGRTEIERMLHDYLGVSNVLWLGGGIAGDDTHGHVDDLARFVRSATIVVCSEEKSSDANYRSLQENRERLEGMLLEDGSKPDVISLPMPSPLFFNGVRLPASYANFYIANAAVIVPTFNDPNDRVALGIISELFTDRPVIGIHAVDLVWGFGTLHCLTQQQPSAG